LLYNRCPFKGNMKAVSTHFVLRDGSDYKDLAPIFPNILNMLLTEMDQIPEDEEILEMFMEMNVSDLERNRKPEGYNRKGKIRLVFPMDRKEFYIRTHSKNTDISSLGDRIAGLLKDAGIKFTVLQNDDSEFD